MTPAYASPEQIRGEPVNTLTDVYALGVLLYRLLAGKFPYTPASTERVELERAILEEDPPPPSQAAVTGSAAAAQVRGDLDAIVLMAIRKDAARRYPSVERLSEDLARWQRRLPVGARKDSAAYRARKFIGRHQAGVAAASLAVAALITATGVSLEFARQARTERSRAISRFNDVRTLANFFLFDFDSAIRAGPTVTRKGVVQKGLEYLDRLEADSRDDIGLQRELMAGYRKIGELQGNIYNSNLGDVPGARASYLRALRIAESIAAADPGSARSRLDLALVYQDLGDIAATAGKRAEALQRTRQAIALLDPPRSGKEEVRAALQAHARIGWLLYRLGDYGEARAHYERYGEIARQFYGARPSATEERRALAFAEERAGDLQARTGELREGLARIRRALSEYRELGQANGSDLLQRDIASTLTILGDLLHGAGRYDESLAELRAALRATDELVARDGRNSEYRRDLVETLTLLASALHHTGRNDQARAATRRALGIMKETRDAGYASQYDLQQYVWLLVTTPFAEFREPGEAMRYAGQLAQVTEGGDPRMLDLLARAQDQIGDYSKAVEIETRALALLPRGARSDVLLMVRKNLEDFRLRLRATTNVRNPLSIKSAEPGSGINSTRTKN